MDYYDTDKIINYCTSTGFNISPDDREQWAMFCCALKVLGYPLNTFVAMSYSTPEECRRVWNAEKNPGRYVSSEDRAKAKICALAKAAGMDLTPFRIDTAGDNGVGQSRVKVGQSRVSRVSRVNAAPDCPPKELIFISPAEVAAAEAEAENSALFNFFCSLFPPAEVRHVFALYRVGATKEFATSAPRLASTFPYLNAVGHCVDVHLMPYDDEGHRRKTGYCQNWLMAKKKLSARRAPWPLFGEHLLKSRGAAVPVGVVESEKSALMGALAAPCFVWAATGSLNNLSAGRLAACKNRALYLFPDADGLTAWEERAAALTAEGYKVFLCSQFITDYAAGGKDDIADIIARYRLTLNSGK